MQANRIESFVYAGRGYTVPGNDYIELPKRRYEVIEFCPVEPSNYVSSAYFAVIGAKGIEYAIDAGDLDVYEGRCADCQQKHAKGACHFDIEPMDEGSR